VKGKFDKIVYGFYEEYFIYFFMKNITIPMYNKIFVSENLYYIIYGIVDEMPLYVGYLLIKYTIKLYCNEVG